MGGRYAEFKPAIDRTLSFLSLESASGAIPRRNSRSFPQTPIIANNFFEMERIHEGEMLENLSTNQIIETQQELRRQIFETRADLAILRDEIKSLTTALSRDRMD